MCRCARLAGAVVCGQVGNDVVEVLRCAVGSAPDHIVDYAGPLVLVHVLTGRHVHAMATTTDSLELGFSLALRQCLRTGQAQHQVPSDDKLILEIPTPDGHSCSLLRLSL